MAFLQYFAAGLVALGIFTVVASIVSPEQGGGTGYVALGVVTFLVGVAVFVFAGRRDST